MTWPGWLAGAAFTLFLAYMSVVARRVWPLFWLAAMFFGIGSGLTLGIDNQAAAGLWWFAWIIYAVSLPVFRQLRERRRARSF